jgi:hypothetical protein
MLNNEGQNTKRETGGERMPKEGTIKKGRRKLQSLYVIDAL